MLCVLPPARIANGVALDTPLACSSRALETPSHLFFA